MKAYEFLHNTDTMDSSAYTVSTHLSKAGAYKAMRKHRIKHFNKQRDNTILFGKYGEYFGDKPGQLIKGGQDYESGKWWGIKEIELLD